MPDLSETRRQAFCVFDPATLSLSSDVAENFHLVVGAEGCFSDAEAALGQLFYSQTGIGVDRFDLVEAAGGLRQPAWGRALKLIGAGRDTVLKAATTYISDGFLRFIVIKMVPFSYDSLSCLQEVDELDDALKLFAPNCIFLVNMGRTVGEAHHVIIGFPESGS